MVLLCMTPAVVKAVTVYNESEKPIQKPDEPDLSEPAPGKPISHGQLIKISNFFKAHPNLANSDVKDGEEIPVHLADLLKGCKIYNPPPDPKQEPTSEYKALMARLRKEEEARAYERMLHSPSPLETVKQRLPKSSYRQLFPATYQSADEDEMTYSDINRQVALIFNVLVTIIACSVGIWIAARHWSTPARLALSMTGSIVVAVAEVVIYSGYLRRLKEAKEREKKKVERQSIAETWLITPNNSSPPVLMNRAVITKKAKDTQPRKRPKS